MHKQSDHLSIRLPHSLLVLCRLEARRQRRKLSDWVRIVLEDAVSVADQEGESHDRS